jgi:hypothetical protein
LETRDIIKRDLSIVDQLFENGEDGSMYISDGEDALPEQRNLADIEDAPHSKASESKYAPVTITSMSIVYSAVDIGLESFLQWIVKWWVLDQRVWILSWPESV